MGKKAIESVYAKDHGSAKAGDKRIFPESTRRALEAHGILEKSKKAEAAEKKADKTEKAETEPEKGKAEAITTKQDQTK